VTRLAVIQVAGLVAWYLLVVQVLLGVVYAAGLGRLMISPQWKSQLHRWVGVALLVAVGVHLGAVIVTHFHGWGLLQALEIGPGTIPRNFGAVAVWLLVFVVLSRWRPLKLTLSPRASRFIHRLSYLILLSGTVHAVLAGPNTSSLLVAGPGIACLTALAAAFLGRHHKNLARRPTGIRNSRPVRTTAQHRA
jgi:hypothetical protein